MVTRSEAAGLAVVAAVLTKGPVGFFPLAAPLLFHLLLPPETDASRRSERRLCWWIGRRTAPDGGRVLNGPALCFLALGLLAAAPIAISPKVSGHYFLPAIPMFALGFASIARGFLVSPLKSRPIVIATFTAATLIILIFTLGPSGSRDAAMLHDLDAIDRAMPCGLTIGACRHPRSSRDWGLHTYTQRWFRVSLDARDMPINGWLLRAGADCDAPASCMPVARGDTLTLFRCPEPLQQTQ